MAEKRKRDDGISADVVDIEAFLKAMGDSAPVVVTIDTGETAPPDGSGE